MGLKSMLEVRPIIDHFSITVGFRGIGTHIRHHQRIDGRHTRYIR
jgi:hypothetical protein